MIDTHAHLDYPQYKNDRDAVLRRAWEAGLTAIVTIGTDLASSRRAVALAEGDPHLYAAVGIHPGDAGRAGPDAYRVLADLTRHPRVVAIGETGLDYHHPEPPAAVQRDAFRRQIHLARAQGLPLIIHAREAYDDVLAILREERADEVGGVMHCFSGDQGVADAALALGFYISFAGPVTFRNASLAKELARRVPLDRLLVETDSPFLSPHPFRGQRNEPARVALVVEEIARLRDLTPDAVSALVADNARRLFRLDGIPR